MRFSAICSLFLFCFASNAFGANILFLDGFISRSINMWNRVLIDELQTKGHNITVISGSMKEKSAPNIHYFYFERISDFFSDMSFEEMEAGNIFSKLRVMYNFYEQTCDGILASEGLREVLEYPDDFKFDLVIHDYTAGPCVLPLMHKFKYPPLISITAFDNPPYKLNVVGGHKYPAYNPHYFLNYNVSMNFWERLHNTIVTQYDHLYSNYIFLRHINNKAQARFKIEGLPHVDDLQKKTVLTLFGSDYTYTFPIPKLPNEIYVGGLQIVDPKPLPEDLKSFVESGEKGTLIMSLGTNIESKGLEEHVLTNIIKTFEQIPQYNFLWKFEADKLPVKQPKNVKIVKFLPQNDLLAHPNLKAFITHAGSLSAQEALWYGKPCIAMPIFLDQFLNARKLQNLGVAEIVDKNTLTTESFKETILEVLENPKYLENVQTISKRFQDQPEKPLERAVWWMEYIIRNPNPEHLQSPTLKLGFLASNSYDLVLVLLRVIIMLPMLIRFLYKHIKKKISPPTVTEDKKND